MTNGISFSGLASGLDTRSIIDQLVALESIPIQQLEQRRSVEQKKLDLVGNFGDLMHALQDAAKTLSETSGFFAYSVGVAQEGFATISASGGALAGSHTLEVLQTAVTDRWAFDGLADPDLALASADGETISFSVNGTDYEVTVDQASSSLNAIAAAIEEAAGADVAVSVVNAGTATNPSHQLVIASRTSGEDGAITGLSTDIAGLVGSPTNLTPGANAIARIDGLTVERSDNDFGDVLEGVSLDVLAQTDGEIGFTVEPDDEAIRGKIEGFVDAYNDVVNFINKQNTFSGDLEDSSALFGDSVLSTVQRTVRRVLFDVDASVVQNDTEGYSMLSLVGLKLGNDSTMSIDDTTFDEKLAGNLELFADLFVDRDGFDNGGAEPNTPEYFQDTTADSGLAASLVREIDRLFGKFDGPIVDADTGERAVLEGIIDARKSVIRDTIERFDEQIERKELLLESFQQTLEQRFAALEELMAQLNAQGAALSSTLLSLPTLNKS